MQPTQHRFAEHDKTLAYSMSRLRDWDLKANARLRLGATFFPSPQI